MGAPDDFVVAFPALADVLGGVRMQFGRAARDGYSGFGSDGGCETFSGVRLRAYVRSCYLESWSGAE